MPAQLHQFDPHPLYGSDYQRVRDFLVKLDDHNYHFGRWDWMLSHPNLEREGLSQIGIWEANGAVVALATYDMQLGEAYLLTHPDYRHLYDEMLHYAEHHLTQPSQDGQPGEIRVIIRDGDLDLQQLAAAHGFVPTTDREQEARLPITNADLSYSLPPGFTITSLAENLDLTNYSRVLWTGFGHEQDNGPFQATADQLASAGSQMQRPNVNLALKIAIVAPDGEWVSYCGMWQDPNSPTALVEPVATNPKYRKQGLAKAAVLEAVRRCGDLGASQAFVISGQQFYYQIGFHPYATSTSWLKQHRKPSP